MKAWLQFFRLPNLPTAPGDALAGAGVTVLLQGVTDRAVSASLAAGAAALFLYMYGLADNDVFGAASDAASAPDRPIPSGRISLRAARMARSACLFLALLLGAGFRLPAAWWFVIALLTGTVCLYNRTKNKWLMGLCRGLSVLAGASAVVPANADLLRPVVAWTIVLLALAWTLYIAMVTKLSEGEESACDGLGGSRYLLGCAAFAPLLALVPGFVFGDFRPVPALLLPVLGCGWTFATWCAAVAPLGEPHGPDERRPAVGRTIGALLYLQVGFLLLVPHRAFIAAAVLVWLSARLVRRAAPEISGS